MKSADLNGEVMFRYAAQISQNKRQLSKTNITRKLSGRSYGQLLRRKKLHRELLLPLSLSRGILRDSIAWNKSGAARSRPDVPDFLPSSFADAVIRLSFSNVKHTDACPWKYPHLSRSLLVYLEISRTFRNLELLGPALSLMNMPLTLLGSPIYS